MNYTVSLFKGDLTTVSFIDEQLASDLLESEVKFVCVVCSPLATEALSNNVVLFTVGYIVVVLRYR